MTLPYTTKTLNFEVKTIDDEQGLIEAYGSVFNNEDSGGDRVMPGAFKRSIKNRADSIKAGKSTYLWPMLWQHDPNQPIGGWYEAEEDNHGLKAKGRIILATKLGQDVYQLIKAGVIREFSIGYEVDKGGSEYDPKSGIRDLTALRLWEISPVTFAMNEEALLVGVKGNGFDTAELKAVCGNTSGPIGPRDEAWDGSKAQKQIWTAAEKDDGSLNVALCKKYFMQQDGDPQKKGSYSYPFWFVGDSPHICVGAAKAIANAVQGARNASAPSGLKAKVETLYARISKKYPNDPELIPPWKGKSMDETLPQRKAFNDEYRMRQINDWRSGWYSLTASLYAAIMDAFDIGDEPMSDAMDALNGAEGLPGFIDAYKAWVQQGIDLGFSDYLDSLEQSGNSSMYGYMSNRTPHERKAGATFSADSKAMIGKHVADVHSSADKLHTMASGLAMMTGIDDTATTKAGATFSADSKATIGAHITDLHDAADDLIAMANDLAETTGATTYDDSTGKPANVPSGDAAKSASPPVQAPGTGHSSPADTDRDEEDDSEMDLALAMLKLGSLIRSHT